MSRVDSKYLKLLGVRDRRSGDKLMKLQRCDGNIGYTIPESAWR